MGHDYKTKEYRTWHTMKSRCLNPNFPKFKSYGARGIKVCSEWEHSYDTFLQDMGTAPTPSHSIDRINNDGNYEPSNCRWAIPSQQARNKRPLKLSDRDVYEVKWLSKNGMSNREVGEVYGVSPSLVSMINNGKRHPDAA